jgi:hypothetical protein
VCHVHQGYLVILWIFLYRTRWKEGIRLAAKAWGWDVDEASRVPEPPNGMRWTNWDVRLAKMIRSAWLFEESTTLASLQAFALDLQANEKRGRPFKYGRINLEELLHFQLPRRSHRSTPSQKL